MISKKRPDHLADQIDMHAQILERWMSPKDARREVRRRIANGQSWLWNEPMQLELF